MAETILSKIAFREVITTAVDFRSSVIDPDKAVNILPYIDGAATSEQIVDMVKNSADIFSDIFFRVVPFGDFYKKKEVIERLYKEVKDKRLRKRTITLVERIPEKRSLWLGQKTISSRRLKDVMGMFTKMDISPVTISKRQDIKKLKNIYRYM